MRGTSPIEFAALLAFGVAGTAAAWSIAAGDTVAAIGFIAAAAASAAIYGAAVVRRERSLHARLAEEAQARAAERWRMSDQLITAEQDERRRLALFLHDTSLQSLAGIALMLDAGLQALEDGDFDQARTVTAAALERQRETIRSLRELSFNLEPVVLRDQGFAPAVRALTDEVGLSHRIKIDLDVDAGEELAEKAQAALYQIIREALHQAIRRGPPTRIDVRLRRLDGGEIEAVVSDDAPGERRRRSFEPIEERARTLSGRLEVDHGRDGGTLVRVVLPPYAVRTDARPRSGPRTAER